MAKSKLVSEKVREPLHLHQMSTKVKKQLVDTSKKTGVAQWVIAEKLLEAGLGVTKLDTKKWLKGLN